LISLPCPPSLAIPALPPPPLPSPPLPCPPLPFLPCLALPALRSLPCPQLARVPLSLAPGSRFPLSLVCSNCWLPIFRGHFQIVSFPFDFVVPNFCFPPPHLFLAPTFGSRFVPSLTLDFAGSLFLRRSRLPTLGRIDPKFWLEPESHSSKLVTIISSSAMEEFSTLGMIFSILTLYAILTICLLCANIVLIVCSKHVKTTLTLC
jgi:hypothetical protein